MGKSKFIATIIKEYLNEQNTNPGVDVKLSIKHIIDNELLYKCCEKLNGTYLLQKENGEKVSETSITKTVLPMT